MITSFFRWLRSLSLLWRSVIFIVALLASCMVLIMLTGDPGATDTDTAASTSPPTGDRPTAIATRPRPTRAVPPTPKPAAPRPTTTTANTTAAWTVLVYLDGDNDLEQSAIDDYSEMASVGSNNVLNIVVQFDRISSSEDWDDSSAGDWRGAKRFLVERGKNPTKSNQLMDLGELNMGDPSTLVDFAEWGIANYPAQHYALIFWDHGASWPGVASDDSSDGDMLTLPELSSALADIQQRTGVQKLDLIGFDACLMGQIDVLQSVAPYGDVAIGSADLEPGEGWAWNAWLKDLAIKPPKDAATLAPSIIKSFAAFYKQEDDPSVTLAAFDLSKVEQMTTQLNTLADAMIASMPASYAAVGEARAYAAEYAGGDTDISAIDLGFFADSLVKAGADAPVATAARALSRTIKAARIVQSNGADHPKSSGISVYFPRKKKHYDSTYVESSPLTKTTSWATFLQTFYSAGRKQSSRASISKPLLQSLPAQPDAPLSLQATISGSDTAYVYSFLGQITPSDPDTIQILTLDYIYPVGAVLNDAIPSWSDDDQIQLTWRSKTWYISNGNDVSLVPLTPLSYGSSSYSIAGSYTARSTGKQIPVSIEFEVREGRGALQHIWALDKGGGDNIRPRELKPKSGDSFTPDLRFYKSQGDDVEEQTRPGTPMVFGAQPLIAFEAAAPNGDYLLGLMVENLVGDITDQYADVTVDDQPSNARPAIPGSLAAPQPGAEGDTLAYSSDELGLKLEYPRNWEIASPGSDTVVFANQEDPAGAELAIDLYPLEGSQAAANRAMLQALLESESQEPGFALRQDLAPVRVAGRAALRVEYVYQDVDGVLFHVIAVAVSNSTAGTTYLITFDAAEATFVSNLAVFEQMLRSFKMQ